MEYSVDISMLTGNVEGSVKDVIKYYLFEIHRASQYAYDEGLEDYIATNKMIMDLLDELKDLDVSKKIIVKEHPMGSLYYEEVE